MRIALLAVFPFIALKAIAADAPKALPIDQNASTRAAAAEYVSAVTLDLQIEGEKHVLTVISSPAQVRIDEPTDRLTLLYDPRTEHYIGLEHSNYTYWEFTWPEVRDAVQGSKRYEARLRDLGPELLNGGGEGTTTPDPNTPSASTTAGSDVTGYIWRMTMKKKRIAGLDCVQWLGETESGDNVEAWCASVPVAGLSSAVRTLRAINEPMALVPVRNLVPPLTFVAWDALTKAGATPLLLTWGTNTAPNRFAFVGEKDRAERATLFQIPKDYMKTTLVTMDGIGNQKPVDGPRGEPAVPTISGHDLDTALPTR